MQQKAGQERAGQERVCRVCRGPVAAGFPRCYQCELHWQAAGGWLADAVMPIAYAVKGGRFASDLWRYKDGDHAAGERLRAMLRDFLRDHGSCAWRAAGLATPPGRVAVVPSGRGRAGPHPLALLVASCVKLPAVRFATRMPDVPRGREIGLGWPRVDGAVANESVLVIDDTWVSGGSAQSVAVALKLAGAARVVIVVLGRHVDPAGPLPAGAARWPAHQCVQGNEGKRSGGPT